MSVRWVRVGEVLREEDDSVTVNASETYPIAGVLAHGRGLLTRPAITGAETSYPRLRRIRSGQVIFSRLKAFEGALAVVDHEHDGMYVSHEFPTFRVDESAVDLAWMAHLLHCGWFGSAISGRSRGVGARRERLSAEDFSSIEMPLPDLDEQRRIAARLDAIAAAATEIEVRTAPRGDFRTLAPRLVEAVFAEAGLRRVHARELYSIVSDVVHPGMDASPAARFVGLEHVEPHTGRKLSQVPLDSFRGRKLRFLAGDVLYGYLRPYLNKVWRADGPGLCSVEQYVLRPRAGVNADLLGYALRSQDTLDRVNEATHRLQLPRIRTALLGDIKIPDVRKAGTSLLDRLESVTERIARIDMARVRQESTLRSLLAAARNEEFARLTSA